MNMNTRSMTTDEEHPASGDTHDNLTHVPPTQVTHDNHEVADAAHNIEAGLIKPSSALSQAHAHVHATTHSNNSEHDQIQQSIKDKTFLEHIKFIVELKSDTVFSTWYDGKGKPTNNSTFRQLWDEAGHCAHLIRNKWGVNKGDRVVLCYDFGLHFFAVFLGCLRAGVTAVLVYPPGPPLVKSLTKMNMVIEDCAPALILTQTSINLLRAVDRANPASKSRAMWPSGVKYQVTDRIIRHDPFITDKNKSNLKQDKKGFLSNLISGRSSSPPPSFDEPATNGSDLAFLQYTSGSTGNPKGVMVTHDALRANIELIHGSCLTCIENDLCDRDKMPKRFTACSWLPQYHDMGLIQLAIAPLSGAFRVHMISPVSFIRNPLLWIDLMSQHKCHFSAAPDFGYRLATRKFNEAKSKENGKVHPIPNLDLSNVYHLQNAAEPARLDTERQFYSAFCSYGLREEWFVAGYGLAENVVGVSFNHGFHLSAIREGEDLQPFVAIAERCNLHSSINIIIVDPDTCVQRPDNVTGEIWIAGASVAAGYYNQAQLTADTFQAALKEDPSSEDASGKSGNTQVPATAYLRTGDYGFYQDDYLYICGRKKDIIIVSGVNYYPQDVEHAVEEASSAVRPGCVAAFSSDETGNDGQLEIVFEIRSTHADDAAAVCQQVRKAVIEQIGLTPATVAAVKERTISKTTSGKIQRRQNRQRLHDGTQKMVLDVIEKSHFFSTQNGNLASQSKRLSLRASSIQDFQIRDMDFYEVVKTVTASEIRGNEKWEDIGLSSMMELELRQSLSQRYNVTIPPNCFEIYPSVGDLKAFLEASAGQSLPIKLSFLKRLATIPNEKPLSSTVSTAFQVIGAIMILFIFALPIVPAFEVGKAIASNDDSGFLSRQAWVLYPLVIITWAMTLTAEVILAKWIVIGRYREGHTNLANIYFLRWWFVDRLMHVWEQFVGRLIMGTPVMVLFYYLMGVDVHPSCIINACVREFDLVKIGEHATISTPIRCRVFGPWKDKEQGPSMRFRQIQVGSHASIRGALLPGAKVGSNCKVQPISVLAEGAQAPSNTTIRGNPGFIDPTTAGAVSGTDALCDGDGSKNAASNPRTQSPATDSNGSSRYGWMALGTMKMLWLFFELYFAFGCFLLVDILMGGGHAEWRYTGLLSWISIAMLTSVVLLITSIILKWALIGKKRPGAARAGVLTDFANWACDYHFRLGATLLFDLTFNSVMWNLVLMAHGMDIDISSKVVAGCFPPSKLDLVTVRRSFISFCNIDVEEDGEYKMTKVEDSSVSMKLTCAPGVTIQKSLITPDTDVTNDMINDDHHPRNHPLSFWQTLQYHTNTTLLYAVVLVVAAASFIPSYELWMNVIKPQTSFDAVPVVVICIVIQDIIWQGLLRVVESIALVGGVKHEVPWSLALYAIYQSVCNSIHDWSFVAVLCGTPMMKSVLRFRGADVQGRLLYFGFRVYEASYITFADGAVIDDCIVNGHSGVFSKVTLGTSYIDGVMHPSSFVLMRKGPATAPTTTSLVEHAAGKMITDSQPSAKGQDCTTSDAPVSLEDEDRESAESLAPSDHCGEEVDIV